MKDNIDIILGTYSLGGNMTSQQVVNHTGKIVYGGTHARGRNGFVVKAQELWIEASFISLIR